MLIIYLLLIIKILSIDNNIDYYQCNGGYFREYSLNCYGNNGRDINPIIRYDVPPNGCERVSYHKFINYDNISPKLTTVDYQQLQYQFSDNSRDSCDRKCSFGCQFNSVDNICKNINSIDEICKKKVTCPQFCNYDYRKKKCIPYMDNVVCYKDNNNKCPFECYYNTYTKKCEGDNCKETYSCEYCNSYIINPCYMHKYDNKCGLNPSVFGYKAENLNTHICSKKYVLTCNKYYNINYDAPFCDFYNNDLPCKLNNQTLRFSIGDLQNILNKNIACKYVAEINCNSMLGKVTTCNSGQLDPIKNKCKCADNYLCGSVDIKKYPCDENYKLVNIKTYSNKIIKICIPKWYYD